MRLRVENLAASRGGETIFQGIGFALSSGSGLLVTGPNGAGKSTLLRTLLGFLAPASGSVVFEDEKGADADLAAHCHYLGPDNAMKPALTVRENLAFWQSFFGKPHLTFAESLDKVGLPHVMDVPFSDLSTGQKRRVAIARLFLNHRPVWILDEPTSGLDSAAEARFAQLVEEQISGGGMVIAATHLPINVDGLKRLRFEGGVA